LKRQIRQELETRLAKEMLGDVLKSGDTVDVSYDKDSGEVKFTKSEAAPAPKAASGKGSNGRAKKKASKEASSPEPTESAASKQ
jgi:ATP-dependent Clp protease ATP-binding subunit ClpC